MREALKTFKKHDGNKIESYLFYSQLKILKKKSTNKLEKISHSCWGICAVRANELQIIGEVYPKVCPERPFNFLCALWHRQRQIRVQKQLFICKILSKLLLNFSNLSCHYSLPSGPHIWNSISTEGWKEALLMNGLQLISFFVFGQILNLTAESRLELFWLI